VVAVAAPVAGVEAVGTTEALPLGVVPLKAPEPPVVELAQPANASASAAPMVTANAFCLVQALGTNDMT
jgi:hypothetical protein